MKKIKLIGMAMFVILLLTACTKSETVPTTAASTTTQTTEETSSPVVVEVVNETEPTTEETMPETTAENNEGQKTFYSTTNSDIVLKLCNPIKNSVDYKLYYKDELIDAGYISLLIADINNLGGYSDLAFFIHPTFSIVEDSLYMDYSQCKESDYCDAEDLLKFVKTKMPSAMQFKCDEPDALLDITGTTIIEGSLVESSAEELEDTLIATEDFKLTATPDYLLEDGITILDTTGNYKLTLMYSSSQAINYALFHNASLDDMFEEWVEIDNGIISLLWADEGQLYFIPSYLMMSKENAVIVECSERSLDLNYNTVEAQDSLAKNTLLAEHLPEGEVIFELDSDIITELTAFEYIEGYGYFTPEAAEEKIAEINANSRGAQISDMNSNSVNINCSGLTQEYLTGETSNTNAISPGNVEAYIARYYRDPESEDTLICIYANKVPFNMSYGNYSDTNTFINASNEAMSSTIMARYNLSGYMLNNSAYSNLIQANINISTKAFGNVANKVAASPEETTVQVASITRTDKHDIQYGVIVSSTDTSKSSESLRLYAEQLLSQLTIN